MTLHMLALHPDVGRLMRFASRQRLLPPGGDLGYAFHAVLTGAFGDTAPKPFMWCAPGTAGGGHHGRLLAYASSGLSDLVARAAAYADPELAAILALGEGASKEMPTQFPSGTRLGFRVRIRPVVRTGKSREGAAARERDVYDTATTSGPGSDRASSYLRWLAARLTAGGARLERGSLDTCTQTRLLTRDRSGEGARRSIPDGPDAVAVGTLSVADPDQFAAMLAGGVGRFRAFGFGMLLLAPPSAPGA